MRWRIEDIEITPDDLVLATIANDRHQVTFLGTVQFKGRSAALWGLHIQGGGPNTMGPGALKHLAQAFMETVDVDILYIEGADRTSGAGPGRSPAPLVFRRAGADVLPPDWATR